MAGVLLLFAMASVVVAQGSDWDKVVRLKPGVRVRILGPDVSGLFVRATESEVMVDRGGRTMTVPRSAVRRLEAAPGQDGFWRPARRGFIIGAVTGAVGFSVFGENRHGARDVLVGSAFLGLVGGGLAGLGAVSEPEYKMVYAAP